MVETSVFDDILDFVVGERLESIHMPLQLTLNIFLRRQNNVDQIPQNMSNTHTYDRYKYNESHGSQYIRDVSEKIQLESDSILNLINNSKVNEALEKLMNCIFLAAHCMKQTHVLIHIENSRGLTKAAKT